MNNNYLVITYGPKNPGDIVSYGSKENGITYLEKAAAMATLQLGAVNSKHITIECSEGMIFDTLNVFYDGFLVFQLGESYRGHEIRYCDSESFPVWLIELCRLAAIDAAQYGRR